MSDNREVLKRIARGIDGTLVSGFDVAFWPYLERSEYNGRVVEACKSQVCSYEEITGERDRTSCLALYLQEMKSQGYSI